MPFNFSSSAIKVFRAFAGWVVVPQWDHPGGLILPQFEVMIADENDDPVPAGTPGEMLIRPNEPGIMSDGYFAMPDRTVKRVNLKLFRCFSWVSKHVRGLNHKGHCPGNSGPAKHVLPKSRQYG